MTDSIRRLAHRWRWRKNDRPTVSRLPTAPDSVTPISFPTAWDFAAVFDHAGLGMVIADEAGRILRINDAFVRLVGRNVAELIGRDSSHFSHPDERDMNRLEVSRVMRGEAVTSTYEKRYVRGDGAIVWARITLSSSDDTQTKYLIATAEDITEQKAIREELIETRRRVSSALIAGEIATYEWMFRPIACGAMRISIASSARIAMRTGRRRWRGSSSRSIPTTANASCAR